jgi:hypothetical protein
VLEISEIKRRLSESGVLWEKLQALLDDHAKKLDAECVFLSGSFVEGFSNSRSDVDFYAVMPESWQSSQEKSRFITWKEGFLICNLYQIANAEIVALQKRLSKPNHFPPLMNESDHLLAHRIKSGIPLVNSAKFGQIFSETQRNNLGHGLALERVMQSFHFSNDAEGAYESKDPLALSLACQEMVRLSTDAALLILGDTVAWPRKWLLRRVARAFGADSTPLELLLLIMACVDLRDRDVAEMQFQRSREYRALMCDAVTDCFALGRSDSDTTIRHICAWTSRLLGEKTGSGVRKLRRNYTSVLTFFREKFLIYDQYARIELSPLGAVIWGQVDGAADSTEVTRRVGERLRAAGKPAAAKPEVAKIVDNLVGRGHILAEV